MHGRRSFVLQRPEEGETRTAALPHTDASTRDAPRSYCASTHRMRAPEGTGRNRSVNGCIAGPFLRSRPRHTRCNGDAPPSSTVRRSVKLSSRA